jgi:hypothetical protein
MQWPDRDADPRTGSNVDIWNAWSVTSTHLNVNAAVPHCTQAELYVIRNITETR